MSRRAAVPIPPFSPLERSVLRALSWELAPDFPELEGLADEAQPSRWFQGASGFVRRTAMAATRPGRTRGQSGVFGSVHAVIDGLAEPMSFQLQLRRGRLVALIADAYGQDVSHIDFATVRFDQLFYLDAEGRSRPIEARLVRKAAPSTAGLPGQGVIIQTVPRPVAVQRPAATPVQARPAPVQAPLSVEGGGGIDRTTLRIGIWVGLFALAAVIGILTDGAYIFLGVGAFWLARILTQPKSLDRIQAALAQRRASLMG